MKSLVAIFLTVTLLSHTCVNVGLGIYYHINKEFIAAKLCENKNKPELKCNGHCYLSKQLKTATERENKSVEFFKYLEVFIGIEKINWSFFQQLTSGTEFSVYLSNKFPSIYFSYLIKPPAIHC